MHFRFGEEPLVFFSDTARGAYRYFIDREDGVLLRFPWPPDAIGGGDEYTIKRPVDPRVIEVFTGRALDPVANLYWVGDAEERLTRFDRYDTDTFSDRIERSRMWKPLAVAEL